MVLNTLLGDHANPNNRLRRLQKEKAYYDSVKSFNVNFSDNGLFGVQVSGPSGKGSEIVKELCDEMQKLRGPITEEVPLLIYYSYCFSYYFSIRILFIRIHSYISISLGNTKSKVYFDQQNFIHFGETKRQT